MRIYSFIIYKKKKKKKIKKNLSVFLLFIPPADTQPRDIKELLYPGQGFLLLTVRPPESWSLSSNPGQQSKPELRACRLCRVLSQWSHGGLRARQDFIQFFIWLTNEKNEKNEKNKKNIGVFLLFIPPADKQPPDIKELLYPGLGFLLLTVRPPESWSLSSNPGQQSKPELRACRLCRVLSQWSHGGLRARQDFIQFFIWLTNEKNEKNEKNKKNIGVFLLFIPPADKQPPDIKELLYPGLGLLLLLLAARPPESWSPSASSSLGQTSPSLS